jgi:hypothetical protein
MLRVGGKRAQSFMNLRGMMMKTAIVGSTLFLIYTCLCCSSQKSEWQGTIEEVDGVTVVKNPKNPMYYDDIFSLEEELSIGEVEGREEYMFSGLGHIAVDDFGSIYALDRKAKHIKKYDKDGLFIETIGGEGGGPGEFSYPPLYVLISPNNELLVTNVIKFSYFSLDGDFIRSKKINQHNIQQIRFDNSGYQIGFCVLFLDENPRYEVKKFGLDYEPLFVFESFPLIRSNKFRPFSHFPRWNMIRNEYVITGFGGGGYSLKIYDLEGNLVRIINKEYENRKVTERDIDFELYWHGLLTKNDILVPELKPPYKWILTDEDGRLFVSTWELHPEYEGYFYDVFDIEGKYILNVHLEGEPILFKDGKLYSKVWDEQGYQYIKRYKVTWNY